MDTNDAEPWLAGVDGCRGGWIAAFVRPNGDEARVRIVPRFADVIGAPEAPAIVAVDMPIGLPERSPVKGRLAEGAVRALLGNRKSSVFRIPSRSAVYASVATEPADERERFFFACKIARDTSEDGKAFAKQGFYILPKIVEIDLLLRGRSDDDTQRVFETHPEVVFWRLNRGHPLDTPKKVKGRVHEPGMEFRRGLLIKAGLPAKEVNAPPPDGAGPDDLLDALACAAVARRLHRGEAQPFPDPPPRDAFGLRMAIWA
jgi:predicted RNase H-like nuclease